jgi:excisionase family DNA binding protein
MSDLLTAREAQSELRISQTMFYALVWRGQISSIRIGKKLLFRKEWVEEFLRRNTRPARAPFVSSHHSRLTIKDKENIGA